MLDLVITDLPQYMRTDVHAEISPNDHRVITCAIGMELPTPEIVERQCWNYKKADWDGLENKFKNTNWSTIVQQVDVDRAASDLCEFILETAKQCIPYGPRHTHKESHPWLNNACRDAIAAKVKTAGTPAFADEAAKCSLILMQTFEEFKK